MSITHPTWSYKEISQKTGVPVHTIYQWAQRYKYSERKKAKLEYETKIIDEIQLESKIEIIKKNAKRNMIDEEILEAYAIFNKKLIEKIEVDTVTTATIKKQQTINKHLNEYFDLCNKHLKNTLDTEELIKTIDKQMDKEDEELNGLAKALLRSHERIKESVKQK